MKKIAIAFMISIIGLGAIAQNPNLPTERCLIIKMDKKQIKDVRLWSISSTTLEYEKEGSLHDLPTQDISLIKTDDEMISFDISGKMIIRPYDLIFTDKDSIKCLITKISGGNIFYLKQKGNRKFDFLPLTLVEKVIRISDTLVFDEISDNYYEIVKSLEQKAAEKRIAATARQKKKEAELEVAKAELELAKSEKTVPTADTILSSEEKELEAEVESYVRESEMAKVKTEKGPANSVSSVKKEEKEQEPTRKFYADRYNNNDLILMKSDRAIICKIDKVTTNRIYYHISQPGPDPDSFVDRSKVLKYVNTPGGPKRNSDTIVLNSGNSFACKIREIKDGHIHYLIYKRGPEARASVDLKYVKSYRKEPIAEFTEAELESSRSASKTAKPTDYFKTTSTDTKVNPGVAVGQFFAGTGVGLVAGGIGFAIGSILASDSKTNSTSLAGFAIGSAIGATTMVAVIGLSSKNTKSNFGATVLGAIIGSLGGVMVMNQLSDIDSPQGQVVAVLASGALPTIGALIGHYATRQPKRSKFSAQIGYNRVGLTYNF